MAMSGSLGECMEKIYELYMQNRVTDRNTLWYLQRLRHENGEAVFDKEDTEKLLKTLKKDKKELSDV